MKNGLARQDDGGQQHEALVNIRAATVPKAGSNQNAKVHKFGEGKEESRWSLAWCDFSRKGADHIATEVIAAPAKRASS